MADRAAELGGPGLGGVWTTRNESLSPEVLFCGMSNRRGRHSTSGVGGKSRFCGTPKLEKT